MTLPTTLITQSLLGTGQPLTPTTPQSAAQAGTGVAGNSFRLGNNVAQSATTNTPPTQASRPAFTSLVDAQIAQPESLTGELNTAPSDVNFTLFSELAETVTNPETLEVSGPTLSPRGTALGLELDAAIADITTTADSAYIPSSNPQAEFFNAAQQPTQTGASAASNAQTLTPQAGATTASNNSVSNGDAAALNTQAANFAAQAINNLAQNNSTAQSINNTNGAQAQALSPLNAAQTQATSAVPLANYPARNDFSQDQSAKQIASRIVTRPLDTAATINSNAPHPTAQATTTHTDDAISAATPDADEPSLVDIARNQLARGGDSSEDNTTQPGQRSTAPNGQNLATAATQSAASANTATTTQASNLAADNSALTATSISQDNARNANQLTAENNTALFGGVNTEDFIENQRVLQNATPDYTTDITQNRVSSEAVQQNILDSNRAESIAQRGAEARTYTSAAEQVSLKISKALQTGDSIIELQLEPAKLGKVTVNIAVQQNGQASVTLTADRAETLDLLRSDAKSLERSLAESGLDTGSSGLNFSLNQQQRHTPFERFESAYKSFASSEQELIEDASLISNSQHTILNSNQALDIKV